MSILLECPLTFKKYMKFIETFNEDVPCPCCGRLTRKHGKYEKTVHSKQRSYRIPILRRKCPDCNKTFSLMPCFTFPWGRFVNHIYEFLGRWLMEGVPIHRLTEWLTTYTVSMISLKTLYRWKHQILDFWGKWLIKQRNKWTSENQEGDGVLSLYRMGMSTKEELRFLLSYFFEKDSFIPCKGRLFSMINLRQSFFITRVH